MGLPEGGEKDAGVVRVDGDVDGADAFPKVECVESAIYVLVLDLARAHLYERICFHFFPPSTER